MKSNPRIGVFSSIKRSSEGVNVRQKMTKIKAAETGAERVPVPVPVPVQLTVKCGIVGLTRVRAARINRTRTPGKRRLP